MKKLILASKSWLLALVAMVIMAGCVSSPAENTKPAEPAVENPEPKKEVIEPAEPKFSDIRRCHSVDELVSDSVQVLVDRISNCDPVGRYFTFDGQLVIDDSFGLHPSRVSLINMQSMTWEFRSLMDAFKALPLPVRKQVAQTGAPLLANLVVNYLHPDLVKEWLTDLTWEQIEGANPDWYLATDWPENRFQRVAMENSNVSVSKIELWLRLFWKRRGQGFFELAKSSVLAAQKKPA